MVVNDIEQHGEAGRMAGAHERSEFRRRTVSGEWREKIDAVITPATLAWEARQRHELDMRHTEIAQMRKLLLRACVSAFGGKCTDMQFIDDRFIERHRPEAAANRHLRIGNEGP
jgi:hypothetical protein